MDDITLHRIGELTYELDLARITNRQLLRDLTDLRLDNAKLRMKVNRLEAELNKLNGGIDDEA